MAERISPCIHLQVKQSLNRKVVGFDVKGWIESIRVVGQDCQELPHNWDILGAEIVANMFPFWRPPLCDVNSASHASGGVRRSTFSHTRGEANREWAIR